MKRTTLTVMFLLCILFNADAQEEINKNSLDLGLGYSITKRSLFVRMDYSLSENSGIYFKGHFESMGFSIIDSNFIGVDTMPFNGYSLQEDNYLRLTLGYRHYFKNKNQDFIRTGWFLDSGLSYRIDIEDEPKNEFGDLTEVSFESTLGHRFMIGSHFVVEPYASFLFTGGFGKSSSEQALFDLNLLLGASFSYSFGEPQPKTKIEAKRKKKRRRKKR